MKIVVLIVGLVVLGLIGGAGVRLATMDAETEPLLGLMLFPRSSSASARGGDGLDMAAEMEFMRQQQEKEAMAGEAVSRSDQAVAGQLSGRNWTKTEEPVDNNMSVDDEFQRAEEVQDARPRQVQNAKDTVKKVF